MMEGVPVPIIQRQLGHASLATTQRYLDHIAPKELVETMQRRQFGDVADTGLALQHPYRPQQPRLLASMNPTTANRCRQERSIRTQVREPAAAVMASRQLCPATWGASSASRDGCVR